MNWKKEAPERRPEVKVHPITHSDLPRILVIDDDPSFGKILSQIASQARAELAFFPAGKDLRAHLDRQLSRPFTAAIIDYDLGELNGLKLLEEYSDFFRNTSVFLVSQSQQVETPMSRWPHCVRGFLHKSLGHFTIFEAALAASDSPLIRSERGAYEPF